MRPGYRQREAVREAVKAALADPDIPAGELLVLEPKAGRILSAFHEGKVQVAKDEADSLLRYVMGRVSRVPWMRVRELVYSGAAPRLETEVGLIPCSFCGHLFKPIVRGHRYCKDDCMRKGAAATASKKIGLALKSMHRPKGVPVLSTEPSREVATCQQCGDEILPNSQAGTCSRACYAAVDATEVQRG